MASPETASPTMAINVAAASSRRLTPRVVALLAGLSAIGVLSTNIMLPAFPAIAASLHISPRDLGVTLSSFFVVFALGQLFVGPMSDRYGRRNLVMGGLGIFVAGSVICAFANSLDVLVAGRVVQALGVCAASVLSRAIARDLFDGAMLAKALSMTMIAMAIAPGFSPLVGGIVATYSNWRIIFVLVALFAAVLAVLYQLGMGETHPHAQRTSMSVANVVRSYFGLAVDARFIFPAIAVSMIMGGLYASFAVAPVILMAEIGLSPIGYGVFTASTVFVVFGSGLAAPRLSDRYGALVMTRVAACLAIAGGLMMLFLNRQPSLVAYTAALIMFLIGMGISNPLGMAIALRPFGERAGTASALLGFLQMSSAALMTALASILPFSAATSLGGMQAAGAVVALLLFTALSRLRQA